MAILSYRRFVLGRSLVIFRGGKPSVNLGNGKRKKRKRNDSEESLNLQEGESSLQRVKTEENEDKEVVGMDSTTGMKVFCDAFPSNPKQTPGDDNENERTIPHHLQSQENSSGHDYSHSSSHFVGNYDEFMHSHEYETEFDVFGKSVAKKLNSMPPNDALRLQQKMEEVMTNFELQILSTPNNSSIEVPPLCEENFVDVKMEVTDDFIE
ncbi:hypothetical protein Anas_11167 [Armadillidium nasatum]|uniref:BESS domain-containing protein n=1 Tax=Armadillidium nasatum TaxID=96803 RepID=A0A5N5TE18_9CRUS|nr:hypothetical protein Anas_11167 [Armadillidium nasatum]